MFVKITVLICFMLLFAPCDSTDDTRKDGAYGESVVDAVLQLLQENCLTTDQMFLRRVALVATDYGRNISQSTAQTIGGIWKVDSSKFNQILVHSTKIVNQLTLISSKLNIDWLKVSWSELTKPLYSGLAAALYLQSVPTERVPETIEEQASFYHRLYDSKTSANGFYNEAYNMHFKRCPNATRDIAFIIDTLSNVTSTSLTFIKEFVQNVVLNLPQDPDMTKISILGYNTQPMGHLYFNTHKSAIDVTKGLGQLIESPGISNTGSVLKFASNEVFQTRKGMRQFSAKSAVLITSDPSLNKTDAIRQAAMLKAKGINVFVIGVGNSVDVDELKKMSSSPSCSSFNIVTGYANIKVLKETMIQILCSAPAILHVGKNELQCDRVSTIRIPGIPVGETVEIIVENGEQTVFGSSVTSQPNAAFNDVYGTAKRSEPFIFDIRNTSDFILKMDETKACLGNVTIILSIGQQDRSCNNQPADVVFVIDSASAVTDPEFNSMLNFVKHFAQGFDIGRNHMKISVVIYADTYNNAFWLNEHLTSTDLQAAIGRVQRIQGQTNTGKALSYVHDNSFLSIHGGRQNALQVVILLTKGSASDKALTTTVAKKFHKDGIRVLVVQMGHTIDPQDLYQVASDSKHLFSIKDVNALETVKSDVAKIGCGVVKILCVEAGLVRNCTSKDIQSSHLIKPGIPLPNICSANIKVVPHPTDNTKYLMCDTNKQLLIVQCPKNEIFCTLSGLCQTSCNGLTSLVTLSTYTGTMSTQIPTTNPTNPLPSCEQNPCANQLNGVYFPGCKDNIYIHCTGHGTGNEGTCDETEIWNQLITNCVNKYLIDIDHARLPVKDHENPCHGVGNNVYFPWSRNSHYFIHCDLYGDGWIVSCSGTNVWHQPALSCIPAVVPAIG